MVEQQEPPSDFQKLNAAMGRLDALFKRSPELRSSEMYQSLTKLRKDVLRVTTNTSLLGRLQRTGGGLAGLFRTPQGRLLAQAEMTIDMFKKVGEIWSQIQNLFSDDSFDQEDQDRFIQYLDRKLKGGIFNQVRNVFKVAPYPGLTSADLVQLVRTIAEKDTQQNTQQQQQATAVDATETDSGGLDLTMEGVQGGVIAEGLEDLRKFFQSLNTSFKPESSFMTKALNSKKKGKVGKSVVQQLLSPGGGEEQRGGRAVSPGVTSTTGTKQTGVTTPTVGTVDGTQAGTVPTLGTGAQTPNATDGGQSQQQQQQSQQQGGFQELDPSTPSNDLIKLSQAVGVEPDRLRKLVQTRGVRLMVNPQYLAENLKK